MTWYAKTYNAYSRDSTEAIANANEIYAILYNRGWTLNAVCGLLGNVGYESGYNPWRWQSDNVQPTGNSPWTNIGYGLTQFTPAGKYINDDNAKNQPGYSPNFSNKAGSVYDGQAQITFINEYADYYPSEYSSLSYADYKKSTESPATLAKIWLHNYERPGDAGTSVENDRAQEAEYWYTVLSGEEPPPEPPTPPGPGPGPGERKKSKLIYYLRPTYRMRPTIM